MNSRRLATTVCLALFFLVSVHTALAAVITVDSDCSLANAIRSANGEAQVAPADSCEAGDNASGDNTGADTITITVEGTVDGVITIDATLEITSEVVIEGMGYAVNGDGNRVLTVSNSLTLEAITITGGWTSEHGGGIAVENGQLALYNSVVRHNTAAGRGGGIHAVNSDVTMVDTAISSNETGVASTPSSEGETYGGGIYFTGSDNNLIVQRSGVSNNISSGDGGGIYIVSGIATISNSTINANTASNSGGGIFNAGDSTLTHVTVIDNEASLGGGIYDGNQLQLYNSILTGNVEGDCEGSLNANIGNLIRDASCNHDGLSADPQLLLLSGAPAYFLPDPGSPVVDAASSDHCSPEDQRSILRSAENCDIGAAEYQAGAFAFQIQSARAAQLVGSSGDEEVDTSDDSDETNELDVPGGTLCNILPTHIVVADASSTTQCKEVGAAGVGKKTLIDNGFIYAVDIFGFVSPPVDACFVHDTGTIVLLDAAYSPRIIVSLHTWTQDNMRCARVDRPGTAVLMPQNFLDLGLIPVQVNSLTDCTVTTTDVLNLRREPSTNAAIMGTVFSNTSLRAVERSTYWFSVTHNGISGWLHSDYLRTSGNCN